MKTQNERNNGTTGAMRLITCALAVLAILVGVHGESLAVTVSLQWGASTGATGYKVYYQADAATQPFGGTGATQGSAPIDVSNQTSATVSGLDPAHAYYFAVTAYNASGESTYSNVVSVPELTPPTTDISYPVNGTSASGTVTVTANASDNVGVTSVEFYVNGVLQGTDTSTPYTFSWNTSALAAGSYALTTKAYDAAGNIGQSATVTVNVVNDTTPPTVVVTSPAAGSSLSGTVSLTASASDNVGVSKVEFYANGTLLSASNVTPYGYSWNTSLVANGSYTLTAKAYDAAGNVGQSTSVSVTVNNPVVDTTPPTVSMTSPASSATVSGTVAVIATATDNVRVTKVEFYLNGSLVSTATGSPYSFSWNTASMANGSYTLSAKAYDAASNVGQSTSVSVTVNNPVADTTPPTAKITSPTANAVVKANQVIAVSATDNVKVTKVEFYVNGVLKSTTGTSPFRYSWNTKTVKNGACTLTAKAYDAAGNVGQAPSVYVTVKN